jgi:co-chaperonin GroES (HSP10)
MITPFNNYIFVSIDEEFESKIASTSGKLELQLMSFKDDIVDKNDEVVYNVNRKKKNYGTVVGIPRELTNDVKLFQEHVGLPLPTRYVDHDIVKKVGVEMIQYECGLWEPTYVTLESIEQDVLVGDKIYFHYNTLIEENKVKLSDGSFIYKLAYQNALCVVRKEKRWYNPNEVKAMNEWEKTGSVSEETKKLPEEKVYIDLNWIIPVSGNILVEPAYDEDVVDIGDLKGKVSSTGLITEINNKPRYLEGIVKFVSSPLKGDTIDFKPGDRIIYIKHADWEVTVEGKVYFCMKYWDVIAKVENEKI